MLVVAREDLLMAFPSFDGPMAIYQSHVLLDVFPVAAYLCHAEGHIRYFHSRAVELWGREPQCGDGGERFCGSHRLIGLDGSPLPHAQYPVAEVLRTGDPQRTRRFSRVS